MRFAPIFLSTFAASSALAEAQAPTVGVSTSSFVQGVVGLVLIIGLLLLTLMAIKHFSGRFQGAKTTGLKVISGLSIGTRERILLIEVGDTWLVIGVTSTNIRTLHTLPKGSLPDDVTAGSGPSFAEWMNRIKDRTRHES